jgi:hypothetical protein
MSNPYRAMCAELTDEELLQMLFDNHRGAIEFLCDAEEEAHLMIRNHVKFARAAIAADRARRPTPQPLPSGYIDPEHQGEDLALLETFYRACNAEGGTADEIQLRGIRAVLATHSTPQPVAVSERLPGAKDCALWPGDPEATPWCWAGKDIDGGWEWAQISMLGLGTDTLSRIIAGGGWTHWLPANALPTPENTHPTHHE